MRRPLRHATSHPLAAALTALGLGCLAAPCAQAGALNLTLTDQRGAPLLDAVALLEPASGGKVAVKPMADVDISQVKRQFAPRVTLITTGTRVNFPNFDTVRHHVYSFSPIKPFELKLYAGVPGLPITFDKPGVAVLGCNIHDSMAAWVVVADTPWSARSAAGGHARIEAVPPGNYRLKLWHAGLPLNSELPGAALTIGTADTEHTARLPVRGEP
jgi:plastocyanin